VALSNVEAEYIATSDASREVVWLQKLLVGLFGEVLETYVLKIGSVQAGISRFDRFIRPPVRTGSADRFGTKPVRFT
jgi:hypothetical protein